MKPNQKTETEKKQEAITAIISSRFKLLQSLALRQNAALNPEHIQKKTTSESKTPSQSIYEGANS